MDHRYLADWIYQAVNAHGMTITERIHSLEGIIHEASTALFELEEDIEKGRVPPLLRIQAGAQVRNLERHITRMLGIVHELRETIPEPKRLAFENRDLDLE